MASMTPQSNETGTGPPRKAPPMPVGPLPPIVISDLLGLAQRDEVRWEPFLEGVDRHWLYRVEEDGPAAALIRFQPGSRVPLHEHIGFEHVVVLSGSQTDENGTARAGTLVINMPGSRHSLYSEQGCLVLVVYGRRVRFLE
jgi:anti-sigma factor ChrR (cupin superfamily)